MTQADGGSPSALNGNCNCGAVRFRIEGDVDDFRSCHCLACRKHHGHIGAYAKAAWDEIAFDDDSGLTWWAQDAIEDRGFCRRCGSSLFGRDKGFPGFVFVAVGCLNETGDRRITRHMCANEKPDYYEIADDLPQLDHFE